MPKNKDLFAPPTKEEIEQINAPVSNSLFSPPTTEELSEIQNPSSVDEESSIGEEYIDPILAGAAQGSTFGFSDELGATSDVLHDALAGKIDLAKWREYQKLREAENLKQQEASPWLYGTGELAGGIASSAALPGLGATRIAAMGRGITPGVGRFLAGKTANAGANLTGKVLTGAAEGVLPGLAFGVGSSKADLSDNPSEVINDAISGAELGGIGGGVMGGAVHSGKSFINKAKELAGGRDYFRQLEAAYDYGTKRLGFGSSTDRAKLKLIPGQRAEDLETKIFKVDKQLGEEVGNAIKNATINKVKINIDKGLQETINKIDDLFLKNPTLEDMLDPPTAKLLKTIAKRELGDLTPIEARAFKDELYKMIGNLAGHGSDQANSAKSLAKQLAKNINGVLKEKIPEYNTAAENFKTFRRMIPETIISKGTPSKYNKVYLGDLKNPEDPYLY